MPAKGKHRRPKSLSLSRGFAVAGTGGAALALPLIGAAGAHAAGAPATATAVTPAVAPQAPAALQAAPAAVQAAPTVYTVVPGDYLSKIAAQRHLSGGWEQLYADNREAVGSNPSLIHPGLKLNLGGPGEAAQSEAEAAPAPEADAEPAAQPAPKPARKQAERPAPAQQAPAEARAEAPAAAPQSGGGFVAPVSGGISTQYKVAGSMWSSGYHTGVDFIASMGTTVKAVGAGTVVSAGWSGSYGNEVVIRHADGKYSQYAHMSQLSVSSGQSVTAGQAIGLSGSTGNSTGPHLHFEIRTTPSYGSDMDPIAYLRSKGASL
ncbi:MULTISPECIES: LysM peptidoglycan-binding domain-containing M23 family metallopeptidase [Streptomyces]|uniref:Peptidase n=1 Tax=Streptomyces spororaveus TaxID=284039 RepID=A0ABQ3T851_9ACTN|nr:MULTISPECIES: LysM peptidoglycan-binding domain-containing M23 family metallopeptidase [Streptomyces]MCM9082993.1 LysM peptidoglycan-binding domain-containing M23 family metallopeptidase [Streptomyces spororaveus]MCX5302233.1 LysM peptidoglycan-binding domain-containing M23 family metallopeptidase [Streptomyces sp. NBC_00160]GHI76573.1 peptidase [Streptomyces spororaveus]